MAADRPAAGRDPARPVVPITHPLDATVTVPGSKSLTNRALVCAALAAGRSTVDNALVADDSLAMRTALGALGADLAIDDTSGRVVVTGTGGRLRPGPLDLDMRLSGTTSRFLLPVVAAFGRGRYRIDGAAPLRARPMGPVLDGIAALGAAVEPDGPPGHLPVVIDTPGDLRGGPLAVAGDTSSQFLSGLLLAAPGTRVVRTPDATTVVGTGGTLRSLGEVDLVDMPDMAQTLAAVAVFADAPTRVTGVELIRGHETDRIAAVVAELRRAGIRADEHRDGFTVHPGTPQPARIETYDDHRMAMSFALLGLRAPGIEIADPACVGKTFPGFWDVLDGLR